jgi:hypothetical protein
MENLIDLNEAVEPAQRPDSGNVEKKTDWECLLSQNHGKICPDV